MTTTTDTIFPLRSADIDGIGNKARKLARLLSLQPSLFAVPDGIVVTAPFDAGAHPEELLAALTRSSMGAGPFAVRSCALAEDGAAESQAGKYHTELNVSGDRVIQSIAAVRGSFGDDVDTAAVLVQRMLRPRLSGVAFSRSPDNAGIASCEFTSGTADDLVSGRTAPKRVDYGRWTGGLHGDLDEESRPILERVFLAATIIEDAIGAPQDIEWAYQQDEKRLYIVQTRDITARTQAPELAEEQERIAHVVLASKNGRRGAAVFHDAAVREVVSNPTRLTRSLLEQLYSPAGALGRGLELIGLPVRGCEQPYITSVFGRLHAHADVERALFGTTAARWWATRKVRRRLTRERATMLAELEQQIESIPAPPTIGPDRRSERQSARNEAQVRASRVLELVQWFDHQVYPVAYAATLLAQLAEERSESASITGSMFRDLSRLHHTRDLESFVERWGHRSTNDYELAEPRFAEERGGAMEFAARFAGLAWDGTAEGMSFTHLKEVAKDRAVACLHRLRRSALHLDKSLDLEEGAVFALTLDDLAAIARGELDVAQIDGLVAARTREEAAWASVDPGSQITLEVVESLSTADDDSTRLRGTMVSARRSFSGVVRHVTSSCDPATDREQILVAEFLEPELVGRFPDSTACIADVGGALSHAAIVAREMGYPVLVLPGASRTLRDGDVVEVAADGSIEVQPPATRTADATATSTAARASRKPRPSQK